MAGSTPKSFSTDPTLYLYTSLTSGSSHIITATARLETILKANKIAYQALDVATDDQARMLWGRRAGGKKLPGLVRMGLVIGDLEQIEEWNEYGELKENVGSEPAKAQPATPSASAAATPTRMPSKHPALQTEGKPKDQIEQPTKSEEKPEKSNKSSSTPLTEAMRKIGFEAAQKAGESKSKTVGKEPSSKTEQTTAGVDKSLNKAAVVAPPTGSAEPVDASNSDTTDVGPSEQKLTTATDTADAVSSEEKATADREPAVTKHRGSTVSTASSEEIKNIEEKTAIPEEDEAEVDDPEDETKVEVGEGAKEEETKQEDAEEVEGKEIESGDAKEAEQKEMEQKDIEEVEEKETKLEDAAKANTKKTKQEDAEKDKKKETKQEDAEEVGEESEDDADEEGSNTQDQPAAEGELAAVSVGD